MAADEQDDLPLGDAKKDAHAKALTDAGRRPILRPEDAPPPAGVDPTITTIEKDGVIFFPRGTDQLPPETKEIQPHPKGHRAGHPHPDDEGF